MKTGFFGGTFNPVHSAHIRLAQYLRNEYGLDEVLLSLSPQNPLKESKHPGGATDADRMEMLRLACEFSCGLIPWDGELNMPRPSYTYNVLRKLTTEGINPVLIIGADNWLNFNRWYRHDDILSAYQIIVYPRPGYELNNHKAPKNVTFAIQAPQIDISSTEIRNNIRKEIFNLPEPVADYIMKHHLYGY